MRDARYEECKRVVVRGLLGLAAGSALLLARKLFAVPEFGADLAVFAGGCIVLYGNGCIIYGLLVFTGADGKE